MKKIMGLAVREKEAYTDGIRRKRRGFWKQLIEELDGKWVSAYQLMNLRDIKRKSIISNAMQHNHRAIFDKTGNWVRFEMRQR